ncbi:hypothetical protein D3C77_660040 [compost metagenome]
MQCLNCGEDARLVESGADGVELMCSRCGHFSVSACVMREASNRAFDAEQTRILLHREREINPGRCPVINSENVVWATED